MAQIENAEEFGQSGGPEEFVTVRGKYPSLDQAYEIALKSFDLVQDRLESVRRSTDRLLVTAGVVTFSVAAMTSKGSQIGDATALSWVFWLAMITFVVILMLGLINRTRGELDLLGASNISDREWLSLPEDYFKEYLIDDAQEKYEGNTVLVRSCGRWNNVIIGLLVLEFASLIVWYFGLL